MQRALAGMAGIALAWAVAASAVAQETARFHDPDGALPELLENLALPAGLLDLAVSADGAIAVLAEAVEPGRGGPATRLSIFEAGAREPRTTSTIEGRIGGLLLLGDDLLAIEHHPAKRREGDTYLVHIDLLTARARRELRLPTSASDLDYWPKTGSLVVAVRNELRTLLLPSFQSGPLFRLPGANLSVALVQETLALVGQQDTLLLVDLATPQTREGLPVRARLAAAGPVTALAVDAQGTRALACVAEDSIFAVDFWPLAWHSAGRGAIVARPRTRAARSTESPAPPERHGAVAPPQAEPTPASSLPPPPPEPEPPPAASPPSPLSEPAQVPESEPAPPVRAEPKPEVPTAAPEAEPERGSEPEPEPEPPGKPEPEQGPKDAAASPPPAPQPPGATAPVQLRGRIAGPGAAKVAAVVVLGPDNLLHEAARIAPGADGRFELSGLAPGRYRVQLDGGRHVPISRPGFHLVEIVRDAAALELDFQVLGAM